MKATSASTIGTAVPVVIIARELEDVRLCNALRWKNSQFRSEHRVVFACVVVATEGIRCIQRETFSHARFKLLK